MNRFNTMLSALCATALVLCFASTAFAAHKPNKAEHFVKNSPAGKLNVTADTWEDANGSVIVKGKLVVGGPATFKGGVNTTELFVRGSATIRGGLTVPSSRRLKYDISGLSGPTALTLLDGLNPVAFKFKGDDSANTHLGFIAEDIPAVLAASDGQGYRPLEIIAVLTKALQAQQTMIQGLQEQIWALKGAAGHVER